MRLGQREKAVEAEVVSTGSLGLDIALGIGGLPRGRDHRDLRAGKLRQNHARPPGRSPRPRRQGGACAFIDAEHALDPSYAHKLGVNIDELLISQPDAGEQALEIADTLVRSGAIDVLVVDSVAALVPRAELEGEMGDSAYGPAGAADEPGPAQAHGVDLQVALHGDLHQPDPHEDRRHVRQSRRPRPAATRSSSTPPCAWTSAASARSRSATPWSATRPA